MTLQTGIRILSLLFLAIGLYCVAVGLRFEYYGRLGPGPGFFPIWIGTLLAGLAAAQIVKSFRSAPLKPAAPAPDTKEKPIDEATTPFFPDRAGARKVALMLVAAAVATFAMGQIGFRVTVFLFCLVAPSFIARQHWLLTLAVALICSLGVAYAFETWLGVRLPRAAFQPLRGLGI